MQTRRPLRAFVLAVLLVGCGASSEGSLPGSAETAPESAPIDPPLQVTPPDAAVALAPLTPLTLVFSAPVQADAVAVVVDVEKTPLRDAFSSYLPIPRPQTRSKR